MSGRLSVWHLRNIHLLKGLDSQKLEEILKIAKSRGYKQGEIIFQPEAHSKRFYLLHHGRVKSYTISEQGEERILQIFHPGDAFGGLLMGVAEGVPIWAEAIDEVVASMMDEEGFKQFMRVTPDVCFRLFKYMSNHHAEDIHRLQQLIHARASHRLILTLLELAERQQHEHTDKIIEIKPSYTHADLANMIGVVRTTVSELISEFRQRKILMGNRRQLILNRVAAMQYLEEECIVAEH